MNKALLALLVVAIVVSCLTGCGSKQEEPASSGGIVSGPTPMPREEEGVWEGETLKIGGKIVEVGHYEREEPRGDSGDDWGIALTVTDRDGYKTDLSDKLGYDKPQKWVVIGDRLYVVAGQRYLNGGDGELSSFDGKVYCLDVLKKKVVASSASVPAAVLMAKVSQGLLVVGDYAPTVSIFDPDAMSLKKHILVPLPKKLYRLGEPYLDTAELLPGNKVKIVGNVNVPENMDWEHYPYGSWSIVYDINKGTFGKLYLPKTKRRAS